MENSNYPDIPGKPFVIPKEEMPQVRVLSEKELEELGLIEGQAKRKRINREEERITPEAAKARFSSFLANTFSRWYADKPRAETDFAAQRLPEIIDPTIIDWAATKDDVNISKFGEYTLNPETVSLDWETIPEDKIKIETLPSNLNGKPLAEVAEYIINTYSANYYIPGIEYWQWILENPDKAPVSLKDKNYGLFFGSLLRDANGGWLVPCAMLDGAAWHRDARWLTGDWFSGCRVVLVEK